MEYQHSKMRREWLVNNLTGYITFINKGVRKMLVSEVILVCYRMSYDESQLSVSSLVQWIITPPPAPFEFSGHGRDVVSAKQVQMQQLPGPVL